MLTSKPPLQPNALLAGCGIFHCKATTENVFDKIPLNLNLQIVDNIRCMKDGMLPILCDHNSSDTLSTKCLGELTRGLMSLNRSPELLTPWFQKIFFIIFF